MMNISDSMVCPACNSSSFIAKYEATYVYSYIVDSDAPGLKNDEEFLPFLFENRQQKSAAQYVECSVCGARYPCYFDAGSNGIDFTILRKAIRGDHVNNPDFLG